MLAPGARLPDLSGASTQGEIALRDFAGQWLVVYFYPKDNTSGCTREAQDFRDLMPRFRRRGARVIGVSRDPLATHARFSDKHALGFALVADIDGSWCKAFDVIHEKTLYGRRFLGIVRSTFLFDPAGKLAREWRGVRVPEHAAQVLAAIGGCDP